MEMAKVYEEKNSAFASYDTISIGEVVASEGGEEEGQGQVKDENKDDMNEPSSSFKEKMWEKFVDSNREQVPLDSLKNMPAYAVIAFGSLLKALSLAIFIYFVYSSYSSQLNAPFLSLDPDSGNCKQVPKAVSGVFQLDDHGKWVGDVDFKVNKALYEVAYNNIMLTEAEFAEFNTIMYDSVFKPLTEFAAKAPPHHNLLLWLHWRFELAFNGHVQSMQLLGTPSGAFKGGIYAFGLASNNHISMLAPSGFKYDAVESKLKFLFDVNKWSIPASTRGPYPGAPQPAASLYATSQSCAVTFHPSNKEFTNCGPDLDPSSLASLKNYDWLCRIRNTTSIDSTLWPKEKVGRRGYNPSFDGDRVNVEFDLAGLTSIIASNLGFANRSYLLDSGLYHYPISYKGVQYIGKGMIDPRYPLMAPAVCAFRVGGDDPTAKYPFFEFCFNQVGTYNSGRPMLSIPAFNHYGGVENGLPYQCKCPIVRKQEYVFGVPIPGLFAHEPCNDFHYLLSEVFFPHNDLPPFQESQDEWVAWFATNPTPSQWSATTNTCINNDPTCSKWVEAVIAEALHQRAVYQQKLDDLQFGPLVDLITSMSPSDLNEAIWKPSMFSILPNKYPDSCGFGFFYSAITGWPFQSYWPFTMYDVYRYIDEVYEPFAFCGNNCTVTTVEIGQGLFGGYAVNENLLQVPSMACAASMAINSSYSQQAGLNPPAQLVEQYYRCTPLVKDAASNAIGIASGWVGTAAPIFTLMLSVLFFLFFWTKKALPVPMSKTEEEELRKHIHEVLLTQTGLETKQDLNEKVETLTRSHVEQLLKQERILQQRKRDFYLKQQQAKSAKQAKEEQEQAELNNAKDDTNRGGLLSFLPIGF